MFTLFTQSFRVFMGSMLMLFVHQSCGDCDRWHILENGHVYSIVINFISLVNFIILYMSEAHRQIYLIQRFDVDKSQPDDNLKSALQFRPDLMNKLKRINRRHLIIVMCNVIVYLINVCVSSYVIVNYYYGGTKTLAGIATNILLVSSKLGEDFYIMYQCKTTSMKGLSTSIREPVSYNVIEASQRDDGSPRPIQV
jgi:hypothetical protein